MTTRFLTDAFGHAAESQLQMQPHKKHRDTSKLKESFPHLQAPDKHAYGGRERKGGKGVREGCKPTTLAPRLNTELPGGACLTLLPKARHAGGIADGDAL